MTFLLRYFESSSFHWCLRVLSNTNYEFCYYCFFYLSSFEERRVFCVNRRTEKRHEYFKIDFNNCIDIKIFELFFLNWWNYINNRFRFKKMRHYFVSNQLWDGQKSFFSLWKRFVNDVRIKIQCYETIMSWAVKDIKESLFLISWNTIYYWNRRRYFDCSIQSFCCWSFWSFNNSLINMNSSVWLWCLTHIRQETYCSRWVFSKISWIFERYRWNTWKEH